MPAPAANVAPNSVLFPGERLEARVDQGGIDLAALHVSFGAPCRAGDDVIIPAAAHAESAGVFAALSSGELDSVSWLERASGLPRWARVVVDTPKTRAELEVGFEPGSYSWRFRRPGKPDRERRLPLPAGAEAHDVISALGAARALFGDGELHVLVGRRLWHIALAHQGSESVSVGGESHDAVRIDGTARRLMPHSFKRSRFPVSIALWLSADSYRMPLRARLTHRDKTVEIDLVDYRLDPPPREPPRPCARP